MNKKTFIAFVLMSIVIAAVINWGQTVDSYSIGFIVGYAAWLVIAPFLITYLVKGTTHLFKHNFSAKAFRVTYTAFWALTVILIASS